MIPGSPPDRLAGLNDAERRILRLLGEGHTAKTIAAELDCGVGSVNERLREARRKTGVGSSRELARLLREQEIRHEQIGVAAGVGTCAATDPYPVGDGRRWGRKGLAMGVFAVAATVAALSFLVT